MKTGISFFVVSLMLMAVMIGGGCSKAPETTISEPEIEQLPGDLEVMQGCWTALNANDGYRCEVRIEGYTLRVKYNDAKDEEGLKRNARIKTFIQGAGQFEVYSDKLPWGYQIEQATSGDLLSISFYDDEENEWIYSELKRLPKQAVAGL